MRIFLGLVAVVAFAGCGGGDSACSNDVQKQFVLDNLYAWYLWNDLLPPEINVADYATPEDLVVEVTTTFGPQDAGGNPVDRFSSVGSLQADQEFFGEGRFGGFGFSYRVVDDATDDIRLSRVFPGSPAETGGLARGQQLSVSTAGASRKSRRMRALEPRSVTIPWYSRCVALTAAYFLRRLARAS